MKYILFYYQRANNVFPIKKKLIEKKWKKLFDKITKNNNI